MVMLLSFPVLIQGGEKIFILIQLSEMYEAGSVKIMATETFSGSELFKYCSHLLKQQKKIP